MGSTAGLIRADVRAVLVRVIGTQIIPLGYFAETSHAAI
jgi:hypothetical protein